MQLTDYRVRARVKKSKVKDKKSLVERKKSKVKVKTRVKENRKLLKLGRQEMGRASTWPVEVGRQRNRRDNMPDILKK